MDQLEKVKQVASGMRVLVYECGCIGNPEEANTSNGYGNRRVCPEHNDAPVVAQWHKCRMCSKWFKGTAYSTKAKYCKDCAKINMVRTNIRFAATKVYGPDDFVWVDHPTKREIKIKKELGVKYGGFPIGIEVLPVKVWQNKQTGAYHHESPW